MLGMYLWVIGFDVGHVFVGYRYRCWSCILWVIGIDVIHVFVGYRYRCWSCISGL